MNKRSLLMILLAIAVVLSLQVPLRAAAEDAKPKLEQTALAYSWSGGQIDAALWGMALGNVDADGSTDAVLLERRLLRIGRITDKGFEGRFTCSWKTDGQAARVDLIDVDNDGRDEAAVTAVEGGLPASLILAIDADAGKCRELVSRARLSLRAMDLPSDDGAGTRRVFVGQGSGTQAFFTGSVAELALKGNKLVETRKLDLPRLTNVYQFGPLPQVEGADRVERLAGPAAMEVRERKSGDKWRRIWRSGGRLGGTANVLRAEQRPALDELSAEYAGFDLPPLAWQRSDGVHLVAVRYDMPLRNAIGRRPYVRGSQLETFRPDPVLAYVEAARTQELPGAVTGWAMDPDRPGRVILLVQDDAGAFGNATTTKLLAFDLP